MPRMATASPASGCRGGGCHRRRGGRSPERPAGRAARRSGGGQPHGGSGRGAAGDRTGAGDRRRKGRQRGPRASTPASAPAPRHPAAGQAPGGALHRRRGRGALPARIRRLRGKRARGGGLLALRLLLPDGAAAQAHQADAGGRRTDGTRRGGDRPAHRHGPASTTMPSGTSRRPASSSWTRSTRSAARRRTTVPT